MDTHQCAIVSMFCASACIALCGILSDARQMAPCFALLAHTV